MIRWIDDTLGTAAFEDPATAGHDVLDVRGLVDGPANGPNALLERVAAGEALLRSKGRLVVCCDYGISRSNIIASAILARRDGCSFAEALERVQKATGEIRMDYAMVQTVKRALNACAAPPPTPGRVLVTGGTGFLGTWLESAAAGRCELVRLGSQDLDLTRSPYALDAAVTKYRPETLIHLANPRIYQTHEVVGQSLAMLRNVADVCQQHGIFLVYPSSWVVFSGRDRSRDEMVAEEEPAAPYGNYAMSKALCEDMLSYLQAGRLNACVLRMTPIYGRGNSLPRFLFRTAEQCRAGRQVTTHLYRNGRPKLQLLHASDAAEALLTAAVKKARGLFNIGGSQVMTTQDLALLIADALGLSLDARELALEADVSNVILDTSKARRELGWTAKADLRDSFRELFGATEADLHSRHQA